MEFTYHGLVRYSFGFDNPNHAATLFAMLLPFGIMLSFCSGKIWLKAVSVISVLSLTTGIHLHLFQSRDAKCGCASVIFFLLYGWRNKVQLNLKHVVVTCSILVIILSIVLLSGGTERFVSWLYAPGRSVTNRFELWRNSLHILYDNPLGVGCGMSGKIYTLFYQTPDKTTVYRLWLTAF